MVRSSLTQAMRFSLNYTDIMICLGNSQVAETQSSLVNYDVNACAEQARSWINVCKYHDHCPNINVTPLPTRILDISNHNVRLHISEGEKYHYCTLSYCWGGTQPVQLLASNLESHKTGLEISCLPQTIQDAIIFTRKLGIEYLWIDSLCIVQDSIDDKRQEIAKMATIYKNSYVTIAATNTLRCMDSFLSQRSPPNPEIIIENIPGNCADRNPGKNSLHLQVFNRPDQEPLNQRAWALQEFVLSPRVVSFGSQRLSWDCQTGIRFFDRGNLATAWDVNRNYYPPVPTLVEKSGGRCFYVESEYYGWTDYVKDLSRRKMTEESDKLPAISGIAQHLSLTTDDIYFAGLWKTSLYLYLMWLQDAAAKNFHLAAKRPTTYRAPSWSWASVDGAVTFHGLITEERFAAKVIHCETVPVDQNHLFGAVSDGHLVIQGPLRWLDADAIPEHFHVNPTELSETGLARMYLDGDEALPSCTANCLPNGGLESSQLDQRIWLLYLARSEHGDPSGCVLRQVPQRNDRIFRRIGWFDPSSGSNGTAFWTLDIPVDTITIV